MADPQQRAQAGTPFRPSAGAWNKMLDAARAFEAGAGQPGGVAVPHNLIRVRNDTGGDLAAGSVLAVGASILDITVPLRVLPAPMFEGTTPAAVTDACCVLIEPALDGKFALAAISGVVPVEINVTDVGHKYATPTASSAARLTSAAFGPARILDAESGTGNVAAVVLLEGTAGGTAGGSEGWTTRGKLDGTLSFGGSVNMSVWWWNGSAEADTTVNVTVYDWLLSSGQTVASGTQVTAAWDARSGRYYVTGAQCEA